MDRLYIRSSEIRLFSQMLLTTSLGESEFVDGLFPVHCKPQFDFFSISFYLELMGELARHQITKQTTESKKTNGVVVGGDGAGEELLEEES